VKRLSSALAMIALAAMALHADTKKLTEDQRRELVRGLTAEWAIAKVVLPMSKKPLPFDSLGTWDEEAWRDATYKNGPAARPGDAVQITKVDVDDDKIKIEINDGSKKGSFWDHVQVGGTVQQQAPVQRPKTNAMMGTSIEIKFPDSIGNIDSMGVKKILAGVLNFDKHTAVETYLESLPEPIKEAIKSQKVIVGMDREQVLLAVGPPVDKVRETKNDVDYEQYIYGKAPGVIRFVTFAGAKVTKIDEYYAGISASKSEGGQIQ
jgi:hypothetical protein